MIGFNLCKHSASGATSQLVTRSSRHTVNSSPVKSSQTHLITQSTRHKRAHNKTTSTSRNHLHAVSLRRHPETVFNTDGVIPLFVLL